MDHDEITRTMQRDGFTHFEHPCHALVANGEWPTKRSFTPDNEAVEIAGGHSYGLHHRITGVD
jgi:hypothetical protein